MNIEIKKIVTQATKEKLSGLVDKAYDYIMNTLKSCGYWLTYEEMFRRYEMFSLDDRWLSREFFDDIYHAICKQNPNFFNKEM